MGGTDEVMDQLSRVGVTIHEVLRYAYGGLLVFLVAALTAPAATKTVVDALGTTMSLLTAVAVGAAVYIGHRPVLGELLYILHEALHALFSWNSPRTCRSALFRRRFHVPFWQAAEAFRTVRDSNDFDQAKQRRYYLQHSELHTLYVTFIVLSLGACFLWVRPSEQALVSPMLLLAVAVFALASGLIGNILLCRQECKALLLIENGKIWALLEKAEFTKRQEQVGPECPSRKRAQS